MADIIIKLMGGNLVIPFAVLLIAILGWLIFLTLKYREILSKAGILLEEAEEGNLKAIIKKYIGYIKAVEEHSKKVDEESKEIRAMAEKGLHKIGFVRYNPFGNVGGNQSFSLCLLDKKDDGFVISSIHSREGTRVYSKKVAGGSSDYNLSEEEKKAIHLALNNN